MALVLNDRVKETTTTTGTGAVALDGAVSKFETFAAGIGNSNTTYYAIVHRTAAEFEIGLGTLDADSSDLTRTTIISSSNSDSAVDFAAGTKDVFCTIPASKLVFEDASSNVNLPNDLVLGSDSAVLKFGADSDTTLTHTDGTGLTLNSTNKLLFRDTGLYINSSTDGQLDIVADSEIQIAATTIDINGAVALNGAITGATNITLTGELDAATLDISGNADIDGTLEADAITVNGTALATVIAGTTITDATNATNAAHVLVTDNENTNEENLIAFVEGATSSTGNVGLEMDGNFAYNPSTGTVSSTIFKGNIDAVDGDFDGTLEADAMTLNGTAITATATLATGISNNNVPKFTSGVADDDFLRVNGTAIEGRSASEVLSDIGASAAAGSSSIVTTGALDTGSITAGFGNIDNGASNITNGGLVKLDVDSDADDVTGDSATGRLTIGAGEDLNLYHGGTNSYVVNDTGLLVLQSAGGVVVNENSANVDFRVESNGDANMFIVDGSANRIGMGVAAPSAPLHVFQAGSNDATTELLLLETGSSTDGSGVKLRMATADTSGIMEMADGTGSFDSEFRFKLSDSSQLATPDIKFTIAPQFATFAVDARFIDGAVASPSICNDGDTNTGIFFRAGDCMSFATEGILALDINDDQRISTGAETGPDVGAGGICIDQNGVDDAFLSVKSSDIAHGMTGVMETDSIMRFKKASPNNGGIEATFVTGGNEKALDIVGVAVTPATAEATNTGGVLHFNSKKKNSTGTQALGADDNAQVFLNNGVVQFIIKGDGELFSNQSATVGTFDTFEDAQLVRAHDLFHKTGVIDSKFDKFVKYNEKTLADNHLIGKDENGNPTPMVNVTGMQRLHNGAIWQQYEKTERLTMAMYELAKEAIGEEKAKAILEKHEVKLLN